MQDRAKEKIVVINASKLIGTGFVVSALGLWYAPKIHTLVRSLRLVRRGY